MLAHEPPWLRIRAKLGQRNTETTPHKAGSPHTSVFEITSANRVDISAEKSTSARWKKSSETENPDREKHKPESQHPE